ncbi:anhydro-N-acetylmuramic acid kinase [Streptomyces caniscabiei]|uniref:anhydro-N-acetylmuramic acid kinase n=2 Tax=Streptomyces caniscabiei TaxID=2746961 RepID=UPI0029B1A332|nr:anhydro-N-acetylmuramic acid kinase [Streptomyces caniscabiei]MDX2603863.1 anhydro-N-acetylmuramic acid kinase [Streptomyces caniscabiei]MDX2738605.1 anhydro-N-acetylmuramic acid kinase [Streptomyces caniscabiei]
MRVIGLLSGTSYDAVDAAAADLGLDGDTLTLRPLGRISRAYDDDLHSALASALPPAATTVGEVCRLDTRIGQAFAALAVEADRELCDGRAELIASHGQTVYHWVAGGGEIGARGDGDRGGAGEWGRAAFAGAAGPSGAGGAGTAVLGTLQLGQPAWIAEATGLPVVADFRARDIAAGGQGAPLVSLVDRLWLRGRPGTPVALNLGGIANLTAADGTAFDTGPANALLDAAVRDVTGGRLPYDVDGALAARGTVRPPLLRRLLAEPYYALPTPKTTGKELFHAGYLRAALAGFGELPPADVAATLTRLTARTVADAVRAVGATEVIASGGGTRNPTLMRMLAAELADVPLRVSDEWGLPADAKEAYAFAVLGFLTVHGLPGTDPLSTGARHPSVLGSVTPGRRGLPRPERNTAHGPGERSASSAAARPPVRLVTA